MDRNESISQKSWNDIYLKETERVECALEVDEDIPWITDLFKERNVRRILDLGYGAGRHTVYLAQKGFDVYGIDISEEGTKKAKQRLAEMHLHASLTVGLITSSLPYPDNSFDAVISTRTIYHAKIEIIRQVIKEVRRVLKPHGLVFVTVRKVNLKKRDSRSKEIAPRTYVPLEGREKGVIHYFFNKEILTREFKDFEICNIGVDSDGGYYCLLGELGNESHWRSAPVDLRRPM